MWEYLVNRSAGEKFARCFTPKTVVLDRENVRQSDFCASLGIMDKCRLIISYSASIYEYSLYTEPRLQDVREAIKGGDKIYIGTNSIDL